MGPHPDPYHPERTPFEEYSDTVRDWLQALEVYANQRSVRDRWAPWLSPHVPTADMLTDEDLDVATDNVLRSCEDWLGLWPAGGEEGD